MRDGAVVALFLFWQLLKDAKASYFFLSADTWLCDVGL